MFKETEFERKIREINLLIDLQKNLFSLRTSERLSYCCLSSECHADSLGTKNVSSTLVQNFWKVNKSQGSN